MKYVLVFGLAAFQCVVCVWLWWPSVGAWAALALYPALSAALLSLSYFMGSPRLLGKRQGRLPLMALLWIWPYLLLSYSVWWAWRALTSEPAYHLIQEGLWLGRRPLAGELPDEVERVVDLTAEFFRAQGLRSDLIFEELPVLDGLPPKDTDVFDALVVKLSQDPMPTYIHCAQGHGRSALVVLAVLLSLNDELAVDEALKQLKSIRPGVSLGPAQRAFLERWLIRRRAP